MGLFTRNTMNLQDMAHLVTYVTVGTIGYYAKQGAWVDEDTRAKLAGAWLQKFGHRASHWKLTKLTMVADGLARKTLFEAPELARILPHLEGEDVDEAYAELYTQSEQALLFKGITK
ncbi:MULTISPECIES: hypothetical protein [Halomonadaceae]|uniref:hypothetical protein n=1 Tax=Halomonadaceae TaxID=28256 RepID=UPI001582B059|nr:MULTISPECIES: hypothetical protein [Halomonas]MDI4638350.1 hypothetical protein [Halomonas sp. BMC7]NUJ59338.1 hypothetical protein [Halomonas taeanensis]